EDSFHRPIDCRALSGHPSPLFRIITMAALTKEDIQPAFIFVIGPRGSHAGRGSADRVPFASGGEAPAATLLPSWNMRAAVNFLAARSARYLFHSSSVESSAPFQAVSERKNRGVPSICT